MPLDHFMAYRAALARSSQRFWKLGPVLLDDGAGGRPFDVVKPRTLLMPADPDLRGVHDPETHLLAFAVRPVKGTSPATKQLGVRVANECTDVLVEVGRPVSLLVPAAVDLRQPVARPDAVSHNVDHFLCRNAKAQRFRADGTRLPRFPRYIQVDATDELQTRRYELKRISKVCTPVAKSGEPNLQAGPEKGTPFVLEPATVRNPNDHLVCYKAALARNRVEQEADGCGALDPKDRGVKIEPSQPRRERRSGIYVASQLGTQQLDTRKEIELCIPSTRDPGVATP